MRRRRYSQAMLDVVGGARPIASAMRTLRQRLAGITVADVTISWHGGGAVRGDIVWLRDERFWWRQDPARPSGRHCLKLGYAPAPPTRSESATCEINLPAAGGDRRVAGAVVRDTAGGLYLAHSGKIGGSRSGRRRLAFRAFLAGGNWQAARWPDGRRSELLLIAPLDGPRLARQIGRFVEAVHRFKRQDLDGPLPLAARLVASAAGEPATPVSAGRADAVLSLADGDPASLAALCDRSLVLDALGEELVRRGLVGDTGADPLFAVRGRGARLLELETRTSLPALERTAGRLLLRSVAGGDSSRAILVVPDAPATAGLAALSRHGVSLVRYRWRGARPLFVGLDAALG